MTSADRSHNNFEINGREKKGQTLDSLGEEQAVQIESTVAAHFYYLRGDGSGDRDQNSCVGYNQQAKNLNRKSSVSGDNIAIATRSGRSDDCVQSIFDIQAKPRHCDIVHFPYIPTVVLAHPESINNEHHTEDCVLPEIASKNQASPNPRPRGTKEEQKLFDYRQPTIQQRARRQQVQRLKDSGLGAGNDSKIICRYVARPYEGAADDINRFKLDKKYQRQDKHQHKSYPPDKTTSSQESERRIENHKYTETEEPQNPDQETLTKIEDAFKEWESKKTKENNSTFDRERKRSASHSPNRVTGDTNTKSFHSSHNAHSFLTHKGNLRRVQGSKSRFSSGGYGAIASPASSRRRVVQRRQTVPSPLKKTFNTIETTVTSLPSSPSPKRWSHTSRPRSPTLPHQLYRNKRIAEISTDTTFLSSSLPELDLYKQANPQHSEMERKGHRPRASSLNKPLTSSATNSPRVLRKHSSKSNLAKSPAEGNTTPRAQTPDKKKESPKLPKRVILNTSLPAASPTFQRAMKGMDLPEKEYTKIFGGKRRDSILQSYGIQENAFNSFRDDNELNPVESSSEVLEKMTNRFREDAKEYKSGWDPQTQNRVRKSILKKRRQSVDDMDIGTRRNLAKYLESKLNICEEKLPNKQLNFG